MTANSLSEFWRIIRAYWFIGNEKAQRFVRQMILTVLLGGGALMFVALLGVPALTATVTLILIIGGPTRLLWQFKYPLIIPIGAIALSKIDEDAWKLVKEVAWRTMQALTLFGVVGLYFSTLSPLIKLPLLERLSLAPIFALAFVVAGFCALVGWQKYTVGILIAAALSSLVIRVGGLDEIPTIIERAGKRIAQVGEVPVYNLALGEGYGVVIPHGTTQARLVVPAGRGFTQWVQIPHTTKEWHAHPWGDVEYLHPDGTTAQDSPVGGTIRTREGSEPYYGLRIRSLTGQSVTVDLSIHY